MHRRFPLEDDSDMRCANGVALPDRLILDARFCLLGLEDGDVLLIGVDTFQDGGMTYRVRLPERDVNLAPDDTGLAVYQDDEVSIRIVGPRKEDRAREDATYQLSNPAKFLRSRVISIPYGIGADTLSDGTSSAWGDVQVEDGINTTLHVSDNNLVLNIRKGIGAGTECPRETGSSTCEGRVLYYLAGQKADPDGNLDIIGGEGVSVKTGTFKGMPAVIVYVSPYAANFLYKR